MAYNSSCSFFKTVSDYWCLSSRMLRVSLRAINFSSSSASSFLMLNLCSKIWKRDP